MNNEVSISFKGIVNEIIWKNKLLCVDKKIGLSKGFFSIGLLEIGDLLSCNNTTIFSFTNLLSIVSLVFFVMSISDSIPAH